MSTVSKEIADRVLNGEYPEDGAGFSECVYQSDMIDLITNAPAIEQGEPVAWTEKSFYEDGTLNPCSRLIWSGRNDHNDFPVGTKFYTAPPQPQSVRDALEKAADIARNACLVPPDGGSPSKETVEVCDKAYQDILALIEEIK